MRQNRNCPSATSNCYRRCWAWFGTMPRVSSGQESPGGPAGGSGDRTAVPAARNKSGHRTAVARSGLRELVIGFGDSGYVALYRHDSTADVVYVLAFRHQKEAGY